ncbi:mechanosensitive ion channel family protein [Siansivirga zeaxanthinifaciens]|uniref:mechanosensitive ion channel family protein n=1 Tax=Siansivirga zeaxanthinifaciens TaxID=762954 RepID=UPI000A05EEF1|nr:mechanosensitive ion channel domain-containing protein [Siansivirga zeaxanthinifaciens]
MHSITNKALNKLSILLKSILFFLIIFSVLFGNAQETDNGLTISDSLMMSAPKAIPTIEIIQNIEKTSADLKITERKLLVNRNIYKIDSLFTGYASFLDNQKKYTDNFMAANPNRQKIDNLYTKWNGYKSYLKDWENEINDYESRNSRLLETITLNDNIWDLTYKNAENENAPTEVLKGILELRKKIDNLKTQILNDNNLALKLETKINLKIELISEVMEGILALKNSETYNLFYLRHPPIWKTSFAKSKVLSDEDKSDSLKASGEESLNFISTNKHSFYLYFTLVVFLFFVINYLKKGFEKYEFVDDETNLIISKDIILKHTKASFIFLSLLIAALFFKSTPKLFENLLILLLLISASYVIRSLVNERFKNIFYVIILLYILDSAKTYIWFHSGFYRIYLLIEAISIVFTIYFFTKKINKVELLNFSKLSNLLIKLSPIIYVLGFLAIVSNVLGYTNLTDITLKISSHIGVISIIFYSLLLISEGISTSLIHRHFSVKSQVDLIYKQALEIKLLKIIRIVVFVLWLLFFLGMVDLLRPIRDYLSDLLTEPYKLGTITFTLGAILSFITILVLSYLLTSLIAFLIDDGEGVLRFLRLPKGIPAAISLVIRYIIVAFGFVFALSSLGLDLSKFNILAGAMGIGIGFGLQTIISNFVAGLILVFERPILQGDTIEVNNLIGKVNKIGVRSSKIKTFDGAEVIVPNYNLMSNNLINWTLSDSTKRIEIIIGTSYDSDPNQVLELLTKAALSVEGVLKFPEPQALFTDFGDSSLNFMLRFWVPFEIGLIAKSDVSIAIYNYFKAEGVEIPFPQRDIHIKNMPNQNSSNSNN